jgi:hypothetical protein
MDHNDIYSIVERLAILEGRITPTSVKHGLNAQQKSVPQMPALFRPRTQKILGGNPDAKDPVSGYMFGDSVENDKEMAEDVVSKVRKSLSDYLSNLQDEIKSDTDLKAKTTGDSDIKDKQPDHRDLKPRDVTPAARVLEMANGRVCEIHGNDDEGYEIRHNGRSLPTRFKDMTHAEMAVEMYNARLHGRAPEQHPAQSREPDCDPDYIEEK